MRSEALILGTGVAASLLASFLSGSFRQDTSIGTVSRERRLDITPQGGAFSIWSVIYTLLIASSIYAASRPVDLPAAVLILAAELLSAAWVPLFLANTQASLVGAAGVLLMAAGVATAAVFRVGALTSAASVTEAVCVQTSFALFAGWLSCAAVLGVGIALQAFDVATPRWALSLLALGVGSLAALSRNPVLCLPCIWALLWQREFTAETAGAALLCVAAAAYALR